MLTFKKNYFVLTIILFITEILIAVCAHDQFIRPYGGDFLVVILIYCFVKSFLNIPVLPTAIAVLIFSFVVETLQYFNIADRLGFQHSPIARIIIGTSFQWLDLVAYTGGIIVVLCAEKTLAARMTKET